MRFWTVISSWCLIAATGERQHCLDFYGKPLRGWSSDFIFWSPALCQGRGVGAQGTAAQLLAVSVANNSNYRQAVKPHEQCPHQSWPISCCDGVCSVSLLQHCHSCAVQHDGGRTALQKLIKAITDNIFNCNIYWGIGHDLHCVFARSSVFQEPAVLRRGTAGGGTDPNSPRLMCEFHFQLFFHKWRLTVNMTFSCFMNMLQHWGVSFSIIMGLFVDRMDNLNSSFPLNCSLWGCQMCQLGIQKLTNIKVTLVHFWRASSDMCYTSVFV